MSNHTATIEALTAENQTLHAEADGLRRRLAELERALVAEEERAAWSRNILDNIPGVVYVFDLLKSRTVYITHELPEMLGYEPDEVHDMGSTAIATLLHPDDMTQVLDRLARLPAAEDREVFAIEYRVRHQSGEWCWFHDRAVPHVRGPDGKVTQFLATVQDITEQKRAEQAQERSQTLLQAFMENTPAMMIVKDLEGRFIMTNSQVDTFFGAPKGMILGKTDHEIFPEEIAEALRAADQEVIATRKPLQLEEVIMHPDGPRTCASIKFPIYDNQGAMRAVGLTAVDITAMKQAEAERAALQAKLIASQAATIRELITPLLPLSHGVVAMPIVGTIDSTRAQQIIETLLEGVSSQQAAIAILDITGVKIVDTQVAQTLVQAAQAAKLLGAQVVLTGIQPSIAQTLVELGADLSGIVTQGTLQSGIAYALRLKK